MSHFKDKVAVVTGAGSGIGRALAQALAREGARLALSDIDEGTVNATVGTRPACTEAKAYQLDVTACNAVFAHADTVKNDFGTAHLLFNNAGSAMLGTFEYQTVEEMEWLIALDLWSVVFCTKAFLPMMLAQREGWVVNISIIAGLIGIPALSAYIIAKFAVRGMTEGLWSELEGAGVRAACVHPGGIKTSIDRASRRCGNAGAIEAHGDAVNKKTLRTPPERCAADILNGIRRGKRRILTGYRSTTVDRRTTWCIGPITRFAASCTWWTRSDGWTRGAILVSVQWDSPSHSAAFRFPSFSRDP